MYRRRRPRSTRPSTPQVQPEIVWSDARPAQAEFKITGARVTKRAESVAEDALPELKSTSTEIEPVVTMKGGKLIADSRDVAATFGKRHDNVLRDIDNLIETGSSDLRDQYFQQVSEFSAAANRNVRHFNMDRDGFSLLAMGFTGEKALRWKLKYILDVAARTPSMPSKRPRSSRPSIPQNIRRHSEASNICVYTWTA